MSENQLFAGFCYKFENSGGGIDKAAMVDISRVFM